MENKWNYANVQSNARVNVLIFEVLPNMTIPPLTMPKSIQEFSLVPWPQDAGGGPELWESRFATPL